MPRRHNIYGPKVVLPNPPYPRATLRVIVEAIGEVWRLMLEEPRQGFVLNDAKEDEINLELRTRLMDEVLENPKFPAFTSATFWVCREAKFESFDGKQKDLMPDLHVAVIRNCSPGLRSADGLFVECKPISLSTPAGRDYCDAGVVRFVSGQYAWAMPHAMMVGYAARGYTIPAKLEEALQTRKDKLKTDGKVKRSQIGNLGDHCQEMHETTHRRGFRYIQTKRAAPDIVIQHLWLTRD